VRYNERKEWLYDPQMFGRADVATAMRIHREATIKFSPRPPPKFFEVDRASARYDQLWHVPLDDRTVFSRTLEIPAVNKFEKPDWRLTKLGIVPQRRDTFILDNLLLQAFDYFPVRGDLVYFNGYRYMIINVVLAPEGYWQQTNVWLGLSCECSIPPEGDARPIINLSQAAPSEMPVVAAGPLPEV
jgi:hypothetical protein